MNNFQDGEVFNQLFATEINTKDGQEKLSAAGQAFIKTKLRENAFFRKIIPIQPVTINDLQRSTQHDQLVFLRDIEPNSEAAAVNFLGRAKERYLTGLRYEIPFFKIESEEFKKNEMELAAYKYPLTKVIEDNSVKDLQYIEDSTGMKYVEQIIAHTGKVATSADAKLNTGNITSLLNLLDGNKLKAETILCNLVDFNNWAVQPATAVGDKLASEIVVDGYKYNTILGRKAVVTNKVDLVQTGDIYTFAAPEALGDFMVLNDVKFWIKKEKDMITMQSYEYVGLGFGNIHGMGKLTLA